ncbi:MAG: hypothetical protein OHK0023_19970 [Anaerolineae bacterium]
MLHELRTLYRPTTLHEALLRLREEGAYPVFGSGAYILRLPIEAQREVTTIVDLADLAPAHCRLNNKRLELGSAATLATLSEVNDDLRTILRAEAPLTLCNTLTLGDVLMEARPDSLLMGALYGLGALLVAEESGTEDVITLAEWCKLSLAHRRKRVLLGAVIENYNERWRFAFEKVSRTPSDGPIVAAIGFAYQGEPNPGEYAVIVGAAEHPMRYHPELQATYHDYKGSRAYRTEMAHVLSQRALAKATALAEIA